MLGPNKWQDTLEQEKEIGKSALREMKKSSNNRTCGVGIGIGRQANGTPWGVQKQLHIRSDIGL